MVRTTRTDNGTAEGNGTWERARTMKISETEKRFHRDQPRASVYIGQITDPLLPDSVVTNQKNSTISTSFRKRVIL